MSTSVLDDILKLPDELQIPLIQAKVKKSDGINLRADDVAAGIAALLQPFDGYSHLKGIAEQEVLRVNTFTVVAENIRIERDLDGTPVSFASGNCLHYQAVEPDIRTLVVLLRSCILGVDLNATNTVDAGPGISELFAAIPTLFPRLDSITFSVRNLHDDVVPGAVYTLGTRSLKADQHPALRARERSGRIGMLMHLAYLTGFPRWRDGPGVRKTMDLVQTAQYAHKGDAPCLKVTVGPRCAPPVASGGHKLTLVGVLAEVFDWPAAKVAFV